MIARRRCPSAAVKRPSSWTTQWPDASGPRWASAAVIASTRVRASSLSRPRAGSTKPVSPHMEARSSRGHDRQAEPREAPGVVRREKPVTLALDRHDSFAGDEAAIGDVIETVATGSQQLLHLWNVLRAREDLAQHVGPRTRKERASAAQHLPLEALHVDLEHRGPGKAV